MVIKMDIKNVIRRGGKFHFRMRVPKDCVKKIGKREIVQSLKTEDPLEARKEAQRLEKIWAAKFNEARTPSPLSSSGRTTSPETIDNC